MAELVPASMGDLVNRLYQEPVLQSALFELPRRKWFMPRPDDPDLSVQFHDKRVGNPAGPAAGPHTQMAQNLLLSYVAGSRVLELKTVQVNDELKIARPCIDMATIGYNVEWSQELRVEESLREYVGGAMLIEMFRRSTELSGGLLDGAAGAFAFDISVGYDLAGIRSKKVCGFLNGMRSADQMIDQLRREIPRKYASARDGEYATCLSTSITLSTFHGCPVDEIEKISEFLIGDMGFDVIVKMNPPTLGRERLEYLLYDVMGYHALRINPKAYSAAISFDESVSLCRRLTDYAATRERRLGFKFSNTLEVVNHRDVFPEDEAIMYLSGQPLHVMTMALTNEFRRNVGPEVPISFSAGIDQRNFPLAVACGFVPVTICTDLLRAGGYGRLPGYLSRLMDAMNDVDARCIDDFIVRSGSLREAGAHDVRRAAAENIGTFAAMALADSRYYASENGKSPRKIDSHLEIFDCITCDKCLPVCPNAANFVYPTPVASFSFHDIDVAPDGAMAKGDERDFAITRNAQIACYADFCNECGNCDTFCPEYGGPYIQKPSFFGSKDSWEKAKPRDGFYLRTCGPETTIGARIQAREYEMTWDAQHNNHRLSDGLVTAVIRADDHAVMQVDRPNVEGNHRIDMGIYHTLRHLLHGVLDASRINQMNAGRF